MLVVSVHRLVEEKERSYSESTHTPTLTLGTVHFFAYVYQEWARRVPIIFVFFFLARLFSSRSTRERTGPLGSRNWPTMRASFCCEWRGGTQPMCGSGSVGPNAAISPINTSPVCKTRSNYVLLKTSITA